MAKIQFKAKIQTIYKIDGAKDYDYLQIPKFSHNHCDMPAFRSHKKYGYFANSTLFLGILQKIRLEIFSGSKILRLDKTLPDQVIVDTSGFLAKVSIDI